MSTPLRLLLTTLCLMAALESAAVERAGDESGVGIIQSGVEVYPASMLLQGISSGEARVVICVDAEGRLTDSLVIGYTDSAFADAAIAALKQWTFEPALVHGRARAARAEVVLAFKHNGGITVENIHDENTSKRFIKLLQEQYMFQACQLHDLDRIPTPLHVVPPALGKVGLSHGAKRTVTVEFYIDQEGRVRVPAIDLSEADDQYAAAAVAAVEQWRFEPPLRKGQPVLVLARQDFTFVAKP